MLNANRLNSLHFWILGIAIALHLAITSTAAFQETPTVDEYAHLPAGLAAWKHHDFAIYSKTPPLVKLLTSAGPAALMDLQVAPVQTEAFGWGPWHYGLQFEKTNSPQAYLASFRIARAVQILLSLLLGLSIYIFLKRRTSPLIGSVMAAGYFLSPTVMAHAHLATVDIGSSAFIFWAIATAMIPAASDPARTHIKNFAIGLAIGATSAAALTAKFTGLFLLPFLVYRASLRGSRFAGAVAGFFLILFGVYFFTSAPATLAEYDFQSKLLVSLKQSLPEGLWIPAPFDFVRGFDAQLADSDHGEFDNYLMGTAYRGGKLTYNLYALLFKESLLTLLLWIMVPVLGLWLWIQPSTRADLANTSRTDWREFMGWCVAFLSLAIPMIFFNPLQVGIRYLLPLFPLLFVIVGLLINALQPLIHQRMTKAVLTLIFTGWVVTALSAASNPIAYFSATSKLFGKPKELLLDSNLDWGQDLFRVSDYIKDHPDEGTMTLAYFGHVSPAIYGVTFEIPSGEIKPGLVIVSPYYLQGLKYLLPTPDGAWMNFDGQLLHEFRNQEPIARIGSLLVFRKVYP